MQTYLVTYDTGRMVLIDGAASLNLARAAAYRIAQQRGWHPNVKHVSAVSDDSAAILRRGNEGSFSYDPLRP